MREAFIEKLKELSPGFDFTETLLDNDRLFVYDVTREDESGRRQSFTEMLDAPTGDRCFQIENPKLENIVAHVCIDGDLIPYGQENYDSANTEFSQGRPDFMIFDNDTFLVVEMKTEQEDLSFDKEKTLWKTFFKGIGQIIDFVKFLRRNGIEIKTYYLYAVFAAIGSKCTEKYRIGKTDDAVRFPDYSTQSPKFLYYLAT